MTAADTHLTDAEYVFAECLERASKMPLLEGSSASMVAAAAAMFDYVMCQCRPTDPRGRAMPHIDVAPLKDAPISSQSMGKGRGGM